MIKNQVKNIIKMTFWVIVATLLGEGVLGVSAYWPFLVLILDWQGVYWVAFGVGIMVAILNGLTIGLPSLVILLAVGILMLLLSEGQPSVLMQVGLILILAFGVNKILGIHMSWLEELSLLTLSLLVLRAGPIGDTIRIKYR